MELSPILMLKDAVYSLRSIIVHLGSNLEEEGGHIETILNTTKGWITCNDSTLSKPAKAI